MICPDGMRADRKKVAAVCYELKQAYPYDENAVAPVAKWLSEMDRPELFIPDKRSDFEKKQGMPGDENSAPDTEAEARAAEKFGTENDKVPFRFYCNACSHEYNEYTNVDQCPACLLRDVVDRQGADNA